MKLTPIIAQASEAPALASLLGIMAATWVIVAAVKAILPGITGRVTLIVSMVVSVALVLTALYASKTIEGDPLTLVVLAVQSVLAAAGIQATGEAILKPKA